MNDDLRAELLRMFKDDQELRNAIHVVDDKRELIAKVMDADAKHRERLREIIAHYGWPGASQVSIDGAEAAHLIAQHADQDVAFQQDCLDRMRAAPAGEVDSRHIATLADRVRVNTGQLQVYGTQFWTDPEGVFGPRPTEEPDTLDERRASVGLGTFEEYCERMRKVNERR